MSNSANVKPSAVHLVAGIGLLVVGALLVALSQQLFISEVSSSFPDTSNAEAVGGIGLIASVFGLVWVLVGIWHLANNVDRAARDSARVVADLTHQSNRATQ